MIRHNIGHPNLHIILDKSIAKQNVPVTLTQSQKETDNSDMKSDDWKWVTDKRAFILNDFLQNPHFSTHYKLSLITLFLIQKSVP